VTQRAATRAPAAALALLCVAQFVLQLDFAVVNIALRTIQEQLHFAASSLQWVATGYALTFGSLLLFGGRLGDVLGRRRLLIAGLWVFGAASLACGLAASPLMLVAARVVQGAGAALMAPTILATLTAITPEGPERNRALSLWTAATAAGGMTGIVAGGVLTQVLGWRSIFLVNLPIVAVLLVLARTQLPALPGDRRTRPDGVGALLVTLALAALIFGLTNGEQHGFGATGTLAALIGGIVLAGAFVAWERTQDQPMIPRAFFVEPVRRVSLLGMFVVGGVFAAYAYVIALYLQRVLGYSEIHTAAALVPAPLALALVSTFGARRVIGRIGLRMTLLVGLAGVVAGQLWLTQLGSDSGYFAHVLPGLLLTAGLGGGLAFPALSVGAMRAVTPEERGLAGGMLPTAQQVGAAVVLAVLATIAAARTTHAHGSLVAGYRTSYLVAAALVAATALLVARTRMDSDG
jgi:EmrB/QacA subfamily drug resistance transporter